MPSDKAMTNAPERIWRLDCQGEILYLETPPYDERTADSVEYIRADKVKEMLDQHAAEQRKRCGYKAAQYLSEDAEGFVSDLNAENAASEILRVCLEAVEKRK